MSISHFHCICMCVSKPQNTDFFSAVTATTAATTAESFVRPCRTITFFSSFSLIPSFGQCYALATFFPNSMVSAAVACAFNFSLGFFFVCLLFCFIATGLCRKSHLICSPRSWFHSFSYSRCAIFCSEILFGIFFSCIFGRCYVSYAVGGWVRSLRLFIFSGVHRLTTFTTLFMFTLYASQAWCLYHSADEWGKKWAEKSALNGNTHSTDRRHHHHEIAKQKNSKWTQRAGKKNWNSFIHKHKNANW